LVQFATFRLTKAITMSARVRNSVSRSQWSRG